MTLPLLETEIKGECPGDFEFVVSVPLGERGVLYVHHPERGWELPGGKVEDGESPVEAAGREFVEETGLEPRGLTPVAGMRDVFDDGSTEGTAVACRAEGDPVPGGGMVDAAWLEAVPDDLSFPRGLYLRLVELARSAVQV